MTALVLGMAVLGAGVIGIWMWSRRRRDQSAPPTDEATASETRGGRRRQEN